MALNAPFADHKCSVLNIRVNVTHCDLITQTSCRGGLGQMWPHMLIMWMPCPDLSSTTRSQENTPCVFAQHFPKRRSSAKVNAFPWENEFHCIFCYKVSAWKFFVQIYLCKKNKPKRFILWIWTSNLPIQEHQGGVTTPSLTNPFMDKYDRKWT